MGLVRTIGQIFTALAVRAPSCATFITAEAIQFIGVPPKITAVLPDLGAEEFTFTDTAPGHAAGATNQGQIYERLCNVEFVIWMPAGTVQANGTEYPNDEEDPDEGDVWLVQELINAIQETVPGGYELTKGGWVNRTTSNLGWAYILGCQFKFPVLRTPRTTQDATVTTVQIEKDIS